MLRSGTSVSALNGRSRSGTLVSEDLLRGALSLSDDSNENESDSNLASSSSRIASRDSKSLVGNMIFGGFNGIERRRSNFVVALGTCRELRRDIFRLFGINTSELSDKSMAMSLSSTSSSAFSMQSSLHNTSGSDVSVIELNTFIDFIDL